MKGLSKIHQKQNAEINRQATKYIVNYVLKIIEFDKKKTENQNVTDYLVKNIIGYGHSKSKRRLLASYVEKNNKLPNSVNDLRGYAGKPSLRNIQENRKISNKAFYCSREWRELRVKALIKHGRKCCLCGRTVKDGIILHVDHIKPRSIYPEQQLELSNLQILCEDCNLGKSNKYKDDWR